MTTSATQNSEKNTGNLKPFKKGQSGNPGGRPKTASVREVIGEFFKEVHGNRSNLQTVLENLRDNKPEILFYYYYGKPAETLNMAGSVEVTGLPADVLERLREMCRRGAIEQGKVLMLGNGAG